MENWEVAFSTITKTIVLLGAIFLLIVCYSKRHLQPLKSRGFVPFTCLICFFIAVSSQMVGIIINPEQEPYTPPYCYIIAMGDFPFYVIITLMMVLQVRKY